MIDKPDNFSWVTYDNGIGGDILDDNTAGADDGVLTDRHTTENCCVGAYGRPTANIGGDDLPIGFSLEPTGLGGGSGVAVIDEHDTMADENIVFDGDALAYKRMALDFAVSSNGSVFLDFDKGADAAVVADCTTVQVDKIIQ